MGLPEFLIFCLSFRFNGWHISDSWELCSTVTDAFSLLILRNIYQMGLKTADGAVELLLSIFCIGSVLHLCYYSSDSTGEEGWIAVQLPRQFGAHLFKGVCDISHGAVLIPNRISDSLSFILDQVLAYLLISSSSLGLQAIQRRDNAPALMRAAIVSVTMSFAAFSVMAACTLLSGYKLCKRIIWRKSYFSTKGR